MFDALTNPKREMIDRALKLACTKELAGEKAEAEKWLEKALDLEQQGRQQAK